METSNTFMVQKIVSTAFRDFKVFRLNLLRALSSSRPHQALNNPLRNMEDQTRTNPGCPPPPLSPSLFTPSSPTHPPISPSLSPLYRKNPSSSPDSPPSPPGSSCQACTFLLPPAGLQVGAGWGHLHTALYSSPHLLYCCRSTRIPAISPLRFIRTGPRRTRC